MTDIIKILQERFDSKQLLLGERIQERAVNYWDASPTRALALVFAHSSEDVSDLLKICKAARQTVVTQGGLTGCVDGCIAKPADVILSLEKMNRIEAIDPLGATVTVEGGVVLQVLQEQVAERGFVFPLDLGARGSCTIGGNIATNAGGINVLRYGMMRSLVLGLEVVLPDGRVLSSMNQMLKNNAGFDLKQLFIGSEGTLGVVTRAVLRLFPACQSSNAALVAMESFSDVAKLLQSLQSDLAGSLSAFEVMWGEYFHAVTEPGWHSAPMSRDYPYYVMLQAEGGDPETDGERFEAVLGNALENGLIVDAVLPKSDSEVKKLWDIREDFEAILSPKPVYLYDVSLPISKMDEYVKAVQQGLQAKWPDSRCYVLGHIGDGNLHFFIAPMAGDIAHADVDPFVYDPLKGVSGSVSAEHGIGTEKKAWLSHTRSDAEIETMRALKQLFDPANLLNRGIVLDA